MVCSIEKRKSYSKPALSRTKTDICIQDIWIEWTTWSSRILWHLPERLTIDGSCRTNTRNISIGDFTMLYRKTLLETEYVVLSIDDHWYREKILCIIFYEYCKYFIFNVSFYFSPFFFTYKISCIILYSLCTIKVAIFFQQFFLITIITDR